MSRRQGDFVGVFDSGVGGISVLARLVEELPHEDFVYFGDSANAPYGEKSRDWVLRRSRSVVEELLGAGAKAIVIACNTATSVAAATMRAEYPDVPIVGVEPALKPATQARGVHRILVMATPITLRLDKYQQLASRWGTGHEVIDAPCPGLAARIEQGRLGDADLRELIDRLVGRYRGLVDAAVLGCTHYPFAARQIGEVLGGIPLFDGASGTARELNRRLVERDLVTYDEKPGAITFRSSNPDPAELDLYERFLRSSVSASLVR